MPVKPLRVLVIVSLIVVALAAHYVVAHCFFYCAWVTATPTEHLAYWQSKADMWFGILLTMLAIDVVLIVWALVRLLRKDTASAELAP